MMGIMFRATLTLALATAGLGIGASQGILGEDTNGDFAVDVLDLQAIIAEMMAEKTDPTRLDVNGDGVVDIRDFQAVLDAAQQAGEEEEDAWSCDPVLLALLVSGPRLPDSPSTATQLAAVRLREQLVVRDSLATLALESDLPPPTERMWRANVLAHGPPAPRG